MNKNKTIRIIGGLLKNSKVKVVEEDIKPTTDRVRVTLLLKIMRENDKNHYRSIE